jgi:hypothetical protein
MKQIKIRTQLGVIASRVFVNGDADLPAEGISVLPNSLPNIEQGGLRNLNAR